MSTLISLSVIGLILVKPGSRDIKLLIVRNACIDVANTIIDSFNSQICYSRHNTGHMEERLTDDLVELSKARNKADESLRD